MQGEISDKITKWMLISDKIKGINSPDFLLIDDEVGLCSAEK